MSSLPMNGLFHAHETKVPCLWNENAMPMELYFADYWKSPTFAF